MSNAEIAIEARRVEELVNASPPWLGQRRRAAWDAFTALLLPSSARDEDWRRTDISKLPLDDLSPAATDDGLRAALESEARQRFDADHEKVAIVSVTPTGVTCDVPDVLAAQGVVVCSLEEAAERYSDLLQQALATVAVGESKFLSLWDALRTTGAFVYVPTGVSAALPVWLLHSAAAGRGLVQPATVVTLGDGSALTLVETYASAASSESLISNAASLVRLGRDAQLDHTVVQRWGQGVWHFDTHRARLEANATWRFFGATFGSRLQKAYWEAILDGPGARAEITGTALGQGSQHFDHQSLQAHRAPDTSSRLLLKVAVADTSRSVYSGLIDVEKDAQRTDGYVQNRNLILGHGAHANSIPRLEIRANDVQCGHGATAGHIDDDQRFYLQARGIGRDEADRMIVLGFLDDAIAAVRHPSVRQCIRNLLDSELAALRDRDG